jgi:hypothetical protein
VTYGGDSGNRIFVLYWRCSLIRVSVVRGSTVFTFISFVTVITIIGQMFEVWSSSVKYPTASVFFHKGHNYEWLFLRGESDISVMLNACPHSRPRLRISGVMLPFPICFHGVQINKFPFKICLDFSNPKCYVFFSTLVLNLFLYFSFF